MQYRNCIFIGKGDKLVRADGEDGDGSSGYGYNGTLSLEERFETSARTPEGLPYVDPVNSTSDDAFMASLYQSQSDGMLAEITDCVISGFGSITNDPYYDLVPNSMRGTNFETPSLPIKALERSPVITVGGKPVDPVVLIDPRPTDATFNQALTPAPSDGFFVPVAYRGAFSADENWLAGWTAADEYGFLVGSGGGCGSCAGDANADGVVGFLDLTTILANWGCTGN